MSAVSWNRNSRLSVSRPSRKRRTAAQTLLENSLKKELERLIGEGGQVLSVHTAARAAGGLLNVTLTAECEEEIGQERPAPERDRPPAEVTLPK